MIECVGKATPAFKGIRMLGTQDLVLEIDDLLIFAGGFRVFSLPVESKRDVVASPESIGMFRPEHFLPDGKNSTVFRFGFRRFAGGIERNGEAVPSQQRIGMRRAEHSFLETYDAAEPFDGFVIVALAILGVSNSGPAP